MPTDGAPSNEDCRPQRVSAQHRSRIGFRACRDEPFVVLSMLWVNPRLSRPPAWTGPPRFAGGEAFRRSIVPERHGQRFARTDMRQKDEVAACSGLDDCGWRRDHA